MVSLGKTKIFIHKKNVSKALDIILSNNLSYEGISFTDDGSAIIIVHSSLKKTFINLFDKNSIGIEKISEFGIGSYITIYKKRWSIIIGLFLMILCVHISSLFVWRIDISGNKTVDDKEILSILKDNGFSLGSYIPNIDFDVLHNKFLLESNNISWISVNMDGNVANVLVKECLEENYEREKTFSNVVAKSDGQITLITLFDGLKTVNIYDVVKKGDILISGIIDSSAEGVRYVHADGIVNAYVNKHISVKIPMKNKVKEYTGAFYTDKSINLFLKNVNILKKCGNSYDLYDKIDTSNDLYIFDSIKLPLSISSVKYFEYRYVDKSYSEREAKDIALIELRAKMDEYLKEAELISKKINYYCDYEFYYIECDLYCIENIAQVVEFEVE